MEFNKTIILSGDVQNDDGKTFAKMQTVLKGDGSTPVVMTMGSNEIKGFDDKGQPIFAEIDEDKLKLAQQEMQAEAIKQQKALCIENGVDPNLVNIINAEKKVK